MLSAEIKINEIDYENTCRHVFPVVSKRISAADSERMIIRLFRELGDAALPVLIGVLQRLPEDTKEELLVRAFTSNSSVLKDKLNGELRKDRLGNCFHIGTISVERPCGRPSDGRQGSLPEPRQDGILLKFGAIRVDYQELLKNEKVDSALERHLGTGLLPSVAKAVVNAASVVAPDMLEKKGIEYLEKESVRRQVTELLGNALRKYGIMIGIDDIRITQIKQTSETAEEACPPFTLTEKTENELISALAGYLRDTVTG